MSFFDDLNLQCKGPGQQAALQMLMNNLHPDVAEDPESLVVYGGSGKAARSPDALRTIVRSLTDLEDDETLLIQSGKAVGIVRTHADAPRAQRRPPTTSYPGGGALSSGPRSHRVARAVRLPPGDR